MAPPIDDLPFGFANSIHTATEEIRLIADSHRQWEMLRWAKSRGGVTIADLLGPTLVSWGGASVVGKYRVHVGAGEAWPVQSFERERVAIRRLFNAQVFDDIRSPCIIGVNALLGLAKFDVVLPKPNGQIAYMAVDPAAAGMVPLCVAISDTAAGLMPGRLHDISVYPFQWTVTPTWGTNPEYPYGTAHKHQDPLTRFYGSAPENDPDDWFGIPEHRIWVYAEPGDRIEVSVGAGLARDFSSEQLLPFYSFVEQTREESAELSLQVNGEFLDGGDMDRAGIGLYGGFEKGLSERQEYYPAATMHRCVLESRSYAIHNICPAVRSTVSVGDPPTKGVAVHRPQLRVRMWPKDPPVPEAG